MLSEHRVNPRGSECSECSRVRPNTAESVSPGWNKRRRVPLLGAAASAAAQPAPTHRRQGPVHSAETPFTAAPRHRRPGYAWPQPRRSAASRLHLGCISATSRLYLGCISDRETNGHDFARRRRRRQCDRLRRRRVEHVWLLPEEVVFARSACWKIREGWRKFVAGSGAVLRRLRECEYAVLCRVSAAVCSELA